MFYLTGVEVQLQKTLLSAEKQSLKPEEEFLKLFAGVVKSKWPSLASILSLTSAEIEEVNEEGEREEVLSEEDRALLMLRKWASREEATYSQLCQRLKTISLFHYATDNESSSKDKPRVTYV